MSVVAREVAEQEVNKWLNFKQISPSKRSAKQDAINALIENIEDGDLVLKEEGEDLFLVQTLKLPTKGELPLTELRYRSRLDIGKLNNRLKQIKGLDPFASVVAYVAALTDQNSAVIQTLDTEDYSISQNIALFFM